MTLECADDYDHLVKLTDAKNGVKIVIITILLALIRIIKNIRYCWRCHHAGHENWQCQEDVQVGKAFQTIKKYQKSQTNSRKS